MSQTEGAAGFVWRGHLHLPFECGICAQPIKTRSICHALISTPDSMDLQEPTSPFTFPLSATGSGGTSSGDIESILRVGDWAIGARYNVEPKPPGLCVESALFHDDCYRIYQHCAGADPQALRYLWFEGLWRQPWNRAWTPQSMRPLPREGLVCSKAALSAVFTKLDLPDLVARLPWEIVCAIFDLSSRALFWKAARAATVAYEAQGRGVGHEIRLVPALDVASWQRGDDAPNLFDPSAQRLPLIRFTIDSQGINQIERIEMLQEVQFRYYIQDEEYLVADEEELQSVEVAFKNGKARLRIPRGHPGFTTWDMPRPPPVPRQNAAVHDTMADWVDNDTPITRMCGDWTRANRFQATAIPGASGLTFIFDRNFLAHVHAHTPRRPIARLPHDTNVLKELGGAAMDQFSRLAWVYLPLPPGEKILSISYGSDGRSGRIRRPGMIVHTKLAGTVFIGHIMPVHIPCIPLSEEPEVLFTRLQVSFVSGFGAYSSKPVSQLKYTDKVTHVPPAMTFGQFEAFRLTSYAPLDNVIRVDTVVEPTDQALRGLIFYYTNGAQRSVGQYKIGHQAVHTYMYPVCLCLRRERVLGRRPVAQIIRVTGSPSCDEGHETHTRENGCACYRLTGFVRAQFDSESISLRFADREAEPADAMEGSVPPPPVFEPF